MQPPPRKVKETQEVKVAFSEQVARLQSKHQQESELLEDIRSYSKQRAAVEKEYGQGLQRLAQQFQKKDWHRGKGDAMDSGSVFAVWMSLVEATVHSGASRLSAAEGYRSLTAEALKSLRTANELRAKRGLEQLQRVQGELVEAVRELNKVKKRYCQLGHIAGVAREKAADAQARSKKSDHGIFHFRTGLHKMTAKLNARLGECDQRLMGVRNEYLLTLAAINSHHRHYHSAELPAIMKTMDGDLYDQVREQLTLLCHTEIGACQSTQSELARICQDSSQVTRERDLALFLQEFTAFSGASEFPFQKVPSDTVSGLQHSGTSTDGESCLDKEARKWATKAAKDYKMAVHGERALHTLERRRKLLAEDAGSGVEQKMEEVKESIRKAQVSRVKAESRLALLASAGVDVDPWVNSAMGQADEELERERRLSEARLSNGDVTPLEDEFEFNDFEDFDENGDIFTESTSGPGPRGYPLSCRVLYSYQGCQADELSITEGEELEVIEDGDMEDWLKARNASGHAGYVPERYLQFLRPPAEGSSACRVSGSAQLDPSINSCETSPGFSTRGQERSSHTVGLARALYQYCGQSAEELTFQEGALIHLLRCGHSDVDDGFWEGELDGRVGVFPSVVVELLGEGEEEEEDEDEDECLLSTTPPPFSPPVPIAGASLAQHCSSSCPGSSSTHSTSPRDPEDRPLGVPQDLQRLYGSRDSSSSAHSSPELSSRRIRPARAPPLPPSHRYSPVP